MHPPFLLLICSFCSFCISSNVHHPHPPSLHQQKLPIWHHKLIIQVLVEILALCADQTGVAYPTAASWPDDLGYWNQKSRLERGRWRWSILKYQITRRLPDWQTDQPIMWRNLWGAKQAGNSSLASNATSLLSYFFICLDGSERDWCFYFRTCLPQCVFVGQVCCPRCVKQGICQHVLTHTVTSVVY